MVVAEEEEKKKKKDCRSLFFIFYLAPSWLRIYLRPSPEGIRHRRFGN
jgi:hypothetical protein